jgi:hypothetical protein
MTTRRINASLLHSTICPLVSKYTYTWLETHAHRRLSPTNIIAATLPTLLLV